MSLNEFWVIFYLESLPFALYGVSVLFAVMSGKSDRLISNTRKMIFILAVVNLGVAFTYYYLWTSIQVKPLALQIRITALYLLVFGFNSYVIYRIYAIKSNL